jgi:hypothetical protein
MGKRGILTLMITLFALLGKAQTQISGQIIDSASLGPLANASVYIVNTTIGTSTNKNGEYSFLNLHPGNYQLIVSCVGYGTKIAGIIASAGQHIINVSLAEKTTMLKEVTIGTDDWKQNLNRFKMQFIGTSNANECKIINDDILNLHFENNRLTASTDGFLNIDNNLLGYQLRFLVKEFWADFTTKQCHYSGSVIFAPLHGKPADEKRWAKNRLAVYNTSFRHFLVSAIQIHTAEDKFVMRKMAFKPNIDKPSVEVINEKIKLFQSHIHRSRNAMDSLMKWTRLLREPDIKPILEPGALQERDIIKSGPQPGTFSLQFTDYLYVICKNKKVDRDIDDLPRFKQAADYQIAAIRLKNEQQPTLFTDRGILLSRESLFYQGAWNNWIMNLMPDDYEPEQS